MYENTLTLKKIANKPQLVRKYDCDCMFAHDDGDGLNGVARAFEFDSDTRRWLGSIDDVV
jgi:hypothetical protein